LFYLDYRLELGLVKLLKGRVALFGVFYYSFYIGLGLGRSSRLGYLLVLYPLGYLLVPCRYFGVGLDLDTGCFRLVGSASR
jgi:hypothetical protein